MTTAQLKAIETNYKGYRFRSRLEARYAVWLDALRFEWQYEQQGFHIEGIGQYLPDFWIPELECFMEVKPYPVGLNSRECRLCRGLAISSKRCVWMVFDPSLKSIDDRSCHRVTANRWDERGNVQERPLFEMLSPKPISDPEELEFLSEDEQIMALIRIKREQCAAFGIKHGIDGSGRWLVNAFREFRSARFEHGESP